jgi:hypothetical protein
MIQDWKEHPPIYFRDIQVLLGFCNLYRRFIRQFATLAKPLNLLMAGMKNGKKPGKIGSAWTAQEQSAFINLLSAFETAPLLKYYDPERPGQIETNTSTVAVGGIYSQQYKDGWHPVDYYSRQLKGPELRYRTPDQEILAIIEGFKTWRHYIKGSKYPTEVITDHRTCKAS